MVGACHTPVIMQQSQRLGLRGLRALMLLSTIVAFGPGLGCAAMEKAAAKDPMKCERDPNCARKRGRTMDCDAQCVDDNSCIERCKAVQQQTSGFTR
jgi:hypothetical protein